MQTTNDSLKSKTTDPEWCFLGEFPLNELMVEMDNRDRTYSGLLFQTIRDMGLHPELLSKIECKVIGFVKEAVAQLNKRRSEKPTFIRLFCQKKTIEDVNSTKPSSQFSVELTPEASQIIRQSDVGINGGWGYFLIERTGDSLVETEERFNYFVDLFLYKEGG